MNVNGEKKIFLQRFHISHNDVNSKIFSNTKYTETNEQQKKNKVNKTNLSLTINIRKHQRWQRRTLCVPMARVFDEKKETLMRMNDSVYCRNAMK